MGGWVVFALGFAAFPVAAVLLSAGWIEGRRFLGRRRKQPAGPIVSILHGKIFNQGKRLSARPLIATDGKRVSYALVLFKEGPNEPCAADPPFKRPFTEPLDDPEETI